jgi:gamma-glutamyltranspeptidase
MKPLVRGTEYAASSMAPGLNSADYIHTSVEAMKLAMADRDTYLGYTDFIKIPYSGLLSTEYAAERRKLIDPAGIARVSPRATFGNSHPALNR